MDGSKWSKAADADRPLAECRHRFKPEFQSRYGNPMSMLATEKYVALAEEYGISPTELALAWSNQRACNTVRQENACRAARAQRALSVVDQSEC